ncbi:MAG: CvpA family protein [Acetobacter sp.]|nr:CvpA family protein [Bacteroides sp.]MCM1340486.1 CvpA family protein [Acetobacter sp.]MCM1433226.1 CvpA family protein [Clostridiales bacterium]
MTVNYVDIAILALSLIMILISARKGILIALTGMTRVLVGVPVSFYVSDNYNKMIYNDYVKDTVIKKLEEEIARQGTVSSFISSIQETVDTLPAFLTKNFNTAPLESLSVKRTAEYFEVNLVRPIAEITIEIVLFLAVFIIFLIITGIIIQILKIRNRHDDTPLRKADIILGAVFGLLKAAVLVFAVCTLAGMAADVLPKEYIASNSFVNQLETSKIISTVNEFNPFI